MRVWARCIHLWDSFLPENPGLWLGVGGTQPLSTARGQEWEVGDPAESVTKGNSGTGREPEQTDGSKGPPLKF